MCMLISLPNKYYDKKKLYNVMINLFLSDKDAEKSVVPNILLSHRKWRFHSNGALHCLRHIATQDKVIHIKCLNSPVTSGRYLVLGFDDIRYSLHREQLLNGEWQITVFSIEGLSKYLMNHHFIYK